MVKTFSILSIAKSLNLSWTIVDRRYALIRLMAEREHSDVADVTGMVSETCTVLYKLGSTNFQQSFLDATEIQMTALNHNFKNCHFTLQIFFI